ncbi:MAG: phage tail family protein [Clostridium sp.]
MITINNLNSNESITFDSVGSYILNEEDLGGIAGTHSTSKSLGQHGAHHTGTVLESRDIPISGTIIAENEYEMEIKKRDLIELINPLENLRLIRASYKIEGRATSTVNFSKNYSENNNYICKFIFILFCVNPFWSNTQETKTDIALWKGAFHFPLIIPVKKGVIMGYKDPSLIVNIVNDGNIEVGMVIEFRARGSISNPSLFNVNTRKWIKIEKSMVAGEVIKVNTNFGKKRVEQYINGVTSNGFTYLKRGSEFLQLNKGDNLFRYDADSNLDNLEVAIYYNSNYLGVV